MTRSTMNDEYKDDENLIDEEDLEGQEDEQEPEQPERDELDEMLDSDPATREAIKEEMRRRIMENQQPAQQQQEQPQMSQLDQVRQEIDKMEHQMEQFFSTPEAERNYEEFEKAKMHRDRMVRQEQLLEKQQQSQVQAVRQAPDIVDRWIREQARNDREITKYADKIKTMARSLQPNILADEGTLRQALEYMVEPNAYKQYRKEQRRKEARGTRGRETPQGDTYMDDDAPEDEGRKKDRFSDASAEERDFLKRVGLLQEETKKKEENTLQPTGDGGYYIPVTRGRRNTGGNS